MESNDDQNLKAINESVGRLVWVRRRNGSWWPGQTLLLDQVPDKSPKLGTPIKLLGRDDVNVDWYVLEKSKSVKAFRCGEYDVCIEKAKAAAALASSSNKKTVKCSRREDAINDALEIEMAHLVKEDVNVQSGEEEEGSEKCVSGKDDEDTESENADELDSAPEQLQSSMSSQDMNNVGGCKVEVRRRRTPNDSEDDGSEGIKRMRGLEDIVEHRQETENGNGHANGNKVCSLSPLKRKKAQDVNGNECHKRKNRRRQLTKVLESSAMVSVPVICDQLVTSNGQGVNDSKVAGMECVESMKSVSVVINNNSDSTGVSCETAPENVVEAARNNKAKDSETSSVSVSAEDNTSEKLFDVPVVGDDKHPAGVVAAGTISSAKTALISSLTRRCGRNSQDVFVKKEGSNGTTCISPPATQQLVNGNSNGVEKSASKWQLKGKRNSRQMSKKQEERRNVYGEEANNNSPVTLPALLHDVKIEVKANYNKRQNVPLVSRMSAFNGKPVVGHPVTVDVFEEEYGNGLVVVKTKSFPKRSGKKRKSHSPWSMKKKKPSSQSQKTRRLSTITSQKLSERSKKQTTTTTVKAKTTIVACIPLKIVFSRINQVLKGSPRQTQQRALPSAAAT